MTKFPVYKSDRLQIRGNKLAVYDRGREIAALLAVFLNDPDKFPLQHRCILAEEFLSYESCDDTVAQNTSYYFESLALLPLILPIAMRSWVDIENGRVQLNAQMRLIQEDSLNGGRDLREDSFVREVASGVQKKLKAGLPKVAQGDQFVGFFDADQADELVTASKRYSKCRQRMYIVDHSHVEKKSIADQLRSSGIRIFESPIGYGVIRKT